MSNAKQKEVLRRTHIHEQQLFITEDDHRNNDRFLKLYPNTVVKGRNAKKHKTANDLNSVQKHLSSTKTLLIDPSVTDCNIKDATVQDLENNRVYEKEVRQEAIHGTINNSYEKSNSSIDNQIFIFHEIADEGYDMTTDSDAYGNEEVYPERAGSQKEMTPIIAPPETITIDPNSFQLQTDAKDGSVTFKVSVEFDDGTDLSDYDIIVTQVTTV